MSPAARFVVVLASWLVAPAAAGGSMSTTCPNKFSDTGVILCDCEPEPGHPVSALVPNFGRFVCVEDRDPEPSTVSGLVDGSISFDYVVFFNRESICVAISDFSTSSPDASFLTASIAILEDDSATVVFPVFAQPFLPASDDFAMGCAEVFLPDVLKVTDTIERTATLSTDVYALRVQISGEGGTSTNIQISAPVIT